LGSSACRNTHELDEGRVDGEARRGRKRRLGTETLYWQLVQSGAGTAEACGQAGTGRKAGYRWRAEDGGLPPSRVAGSARSSRCLSLLERQRIATLHRDGPGVRAIAARLGRAPSTVSRELRRNTLPHDNGHYDGDLAHARARQRARRPRRGRLLAGPALRAKIQEKPELEWSPGQIAAWLRLTCPGRPGWRVCHETICQALCHGGKGGLSRQLTRKLRTGRPLRKRRRRPGQRRTRFTVPIVLIGHRPPAAASRQRAGDWEGDLITGQRGQSAIAALVDRCSRYVRLAHLPADHGAGAVRDALTALPGTLPEQARLTLTGDQGPEMALHGQVAPLPPGGVFSARPASPWQRGSNENASGLLRQYFPKRTSLSARTPEDLRAVGERPGSRPRETLNWQAPAAIFSAALSTGTQEPGGEAPWMHTGIVR
jgi:IS30 family transposase